MNVKVKPDIPTVPRDEDFSQLKRMFKEWKNLTGVKKEAYAQTIVVVANDLQMYYERGLLLPVDVRVKKGLETRIRELEGMKEEVEEFV
jgi:hypothetical protein